MSTKEPSGSAGRAPASSEGADRIDRGAKSRRDTAPGVTESERIRQDSLVRDALLRALTDNSPDAIYVKDTQSRWLMANPAVLRIVGLSAQAALGKTDLELYADPEIGKAILENDRRILRGKSAETFEEWADTADGRRLFLSTKAPWFDGRGNVAGLIGISHDITQLKQAEERLRASEEKFAKAFRNSPNAITITRLSDGKIIEGNESAYELFGYSRDEVIGKTTADLNIWADAADRQRLVKGLASQGSIKNEDFVLRKKDGSRISVSLSASLITFDGQECFLASFIDITDRKRAEEALRVSEERYRLLVQYAPAGIFGLDLVTGKFTEVNEVICRILGYSREEFLALDPVDLLDEEGRDRLVKRIQAGARGVIATEAAEYRVRRKDGEFIWALVNATYQREAGVATQATVVAHDISERKRAEERQRESERGLAEANRQRNDILESISECFYALDKDLRFTYVNKGAEEIWGLSRADLIGRKIEEVFAGRIDLSLSKFHQVLEERTPQHYEIFSEVVQRWGFMSVYPTREGISVYFLDISKRKRAEEAMRESEERFRALNETSPIGVGVSSAEGVLLYTNPAYDSILGYERDELLGRRASELYVNPGDRTSWLDRMENGGAVRNVEVRLKRKDGVPIWASINTSPIRYEGRQAVIGTIQDVTERKQAEDLREALVEQERSRLGAAVEQASDAVVMVDLDGLIRYVNAAFESINRRPRGETVGTSYFDLLAGETAATAEIREAVASGRPWHGPLIRIVRDARAVELEVTVSPAKDPFGAAIGGLITEKDVTRENALQNQVRQAQKMEALGTLAGGITHDFNNILGSIVLNTELALLDLDPGSPARQPLPFVLQAANRGKDLVKQIITFSRQRIWEKKPVEIAPIVKEGLVFLQTTLPKDVLIQEAIDAGSGIVLADPSHINQVLVNLCQNAALAMPDGGRLEVALAPVEVDEATSFRLPSLRPGPYVRLTVADSGCGMTKEVQERIFEPFFTTRPKGAGSGLGLAVVHGIVRTYDGEITVVSEPGKGSTFNVYLPRLDGQKLAAGIETQEGPWKGEERVLLVEDEAAQRKSLAQGLAHLGYKVTAKADGRSALGAFRKDPSAFDVVITDQIMPRMTGLELASEITTLRPDTPIVLCTGFSEKVNETDLAQSGVRELLMKPFTLAEATRLIRKVRD